MDRTLLDAMAARLALDEQEFRLLVSRADRIVARATLPGGEVVVKAAMTTGAFDHEAAAMERLATIGIPVSEVVLLEHGPPAMLVASWVEGEPITATTGDAVVREVGSMLRRVHSLPATAPWSGHATIAGWIEAWVERVVLWWVEAAGARVVDGDRVLAWLGEVRTLLDDANGCHMLFDGRPDHMLVGADGQIRLIDVADLQPGDPAMDLAVLELEAPGILDPVLAGYALTPAERARFGRIIPFYVLLRALAAAEWQARVVGDPEASRWYLDRAQDTLTMHRDTVSLPPDG